MPYELRDFRPAMEFLEQDPAPNLMLLRALREGLRPGFSVIVDDPGHAQACMTVSHPDWRHTPGGFLQVQVEATGPKVATELLSWLPRGPRYRIRSYRPWLHDLLRPLMAAEAMSHAVHCVATYGGFLPAPLQDQAEELDPENLQFRTRVPFLHNWAQGRRLFGIVREGELLACSALGSPDSDYVSIQSVYTMKHARAIGLGSAVLGAATQAGLDAGKLVSYGLKANDLPSLRMLAGLGFAPACKEWTVEGLLQG